MSARSSGSSLSLFKLNRIWDVIVLAVAFFFVFLAFSVVQNMASTVLPSTVAFPMLGCLYLAFALINLFGAAPLVDRIGTRPAMFFATITYTIFDASNVVAMLLADHLSAQFAVLIPSSVLIGAGAAILWTAQGSYVVKCASKYTIGRYTGVFFGIMSASNSVGPLFTSFLLENKFDKENAFKILSGVGALGPLLILLYIWWLRPEPSNSTFHSESSATEGQLATVDSTPLFLKVFKLVTCKKMWMVAPLFYLNSVEQTLGHFHYLSTLVMLELT
ncbi:major facilitator superfamily domain-containing protein [Chytriomyces sp. MP71]|nr:major facilitator superfamily domain-containing protein [Chytriomyces sp. MP71]